MQLYVESYILCKFSCFTQSIRSANRVYLSFSSPTFYYILSLSVSLSVILSLSASLSTFAAASLLGKIKRVRFFDFLICRISLMSCSAAVALSPNPS